MIPAQQLRFAEAAPAAPQPPIAAANPKNEPAHEARRENALVIPPNRERILPPHLERIMMDPEAERADVNGAIAAGFGRFGAFLQNFETQSQEEARRIEGRVRALVGEQNALQRRLDQEGPNNAALRENLRLVNERLRAFFEAIPAARVGEIDRRVNQLELDQLRQRLAVLEQPAPRAANQPDPVAQLQQRVAALEQPAPRAANQPDPVVQLQQRVVALEKPAPRAVNQPDPLAQILQRVAALEQPAPRAANQPDLAQLLQRINALEQPAPNPAAAPAAPVAAAPAAPAPNLPAPNPVAEIPVPNQPVLNPTLARIPARLAQLEDAENARRRERENQDRQAEISRIRQRLLLNVAAGESALLASGLTFTASTTGTLVPGVALAEGVVGYVIKFGARNCVKRACTAVANPFPVVSLVAFAAFTSASVASGIWAKNQSDKLERNKYLLTCFDRHIQSDLTPQLAERNALADVNRKYNTV